MQNFSAFKLLPSWKPMQFHGQTVRKNISDTLWRKRIRKYMLDQYDYTCCICGHKENQEQSRRLHVHEVEEYDLENMICHLHSLELLCVKCHAFSHFRFSFSFATPEHVADLEEHFMRLNNCDRNTLRECVRFSAKQYAEKNKLVDEKSQKERIYTMLNPKPATFTVSENIPFYDEIVAQLRRKGLLYEA